MRSMLMVSLTLPQYDPYLRVRSLAALAGMEGGYLFGMGVAWSVLNMVFEFEIPVSIYAKL